MASFTTMVLCLALGVLLLCLCLIIVMFISLAKQGDERRKMIISKTSTYTFGVMVGFLVISVVEGIVISFSQGAPTKGINPFIMLSVLAVIYTTLLLYFKKKHGD